MSFRVIFSDELKKNLSVLKRKDTTLYRAVEKKILQIASTDPKSIQHYKNLRGILRDFKRVHIGSYVLLFRIAGDTIFFEYLDHHDTVYKIKP